MKNCWSCDPDNRPTFDEIYVMLSIERVGLCLRVGGKVGYAVGINVSGACGELGAFDVIGAFVNGSGVVEGVEIGTLEGAIGSPVKGSGAVEGVEIGTLEGVIGSLVKGSGAVEGVEIGTLEGVIGSPVKGFGELEGMIAIDGGMNGDPVVGGTVRALG